ncbi:MraY family glycosyltransferase [Legionella sp.]|uniref:MraY family glycosyltransferase n=1 Tax=Legionella sp. TaxID=459 RepID=UPI003CC3F032
MNLILSLVFLVLSVILTKVFCVLSEGTRLMDKPNDRSMHSKPMIRGGGFVFISLCLLSLPVLCYLTQTSIYSQWVLALGILIIATVSFLDDLYHLSVKPRFLAQGVVALLIAFFIKPEQLNFVFFSINYSVFIIPFVFVMGLWAINHFNFMDGLDGFCACQAVFLFAVYATLFAIHGSSFYQSFCLILAFSLIGFLIFNFPPAKLFMGDIGSATLGLITFCIALIAQQQFQVPILYWFMLNGLFLFDATCTLIRRMIKKEQWSTPHKKHAYQRLRQSGISVHMILFGQLLINCFFFILVFLLNMRFFDSRLLISLQIGIIFLIYFLIEKIFPMFQSEFTH